MNVRTIFLFLHEEHSLRVLPHLSNEPSRSYSLFRPLDKVPMTLAFYATWLLVYTTVLTWKRFQNHEKYGECTKFLSGFHRTEKVDYIM